MFNVSICFSMSQPPAIIDYSTTETIKVIKFTAPITIEGILTGSLTINEGDYGFIRKDVPYYFVVEKSPYNDSYMPNIDTFGAKIIAIKNNADKILSSGKYSILRTLSDIGNEIELREKCFRIAYKDMCNTYPKKYLFYYPSDIRSELNPIHNVLCHIHTEEALGGELRRLVYTELCNKYPDEYRISNWDAISKGEVAVGFTKREALLCKGAPRDTNKTGTAAGVTEQWVYYSGDYPSRYLYFQNEKLTMWQN